MCLVWGKVKCRSEEIKVHSFPAARIQDMYYYLVPLLRKRPDKIILHVGTNDAPHMKADEMLEELGNLGKSLNWEMLSSVKIVLSAPTIRVDKHNANENNMDFIKLLEINNNVLVKHPNIKENQLDRYGLHLNHDGTRVLAKNLRLCAQKYWHHKDSLKQIFTLLNRVKKHSKQITNDLNHESNFVHSVGENDLALNISPIDSEAPNNNLQDEMLVLKNLRVSYPNNIIIGHLNINSFRKKFEMLSLSVAQYVDV